MSNEGKEPTQKSDSELNSKPGFETIGNDVEILSAEIAANPSSTAEDRSLFADSIVSSASATADYLIAGTMVRVETDP